MITGSIKRGTAGEMAAILAIFLIPFLLLFVYTGMKVEVSLLKRKLKIVSLKKEELTRSNDSLKRELAELSGNSVEQIYWEKHGILPFYVKNRVINVRLDRESLEAQRPDPSLQEESRDHSR